MATTTVQMNTQLTKDKAAQTNTATPSLKTRELAGLLSSNIHYHQNKLFDARIDLDGVDINFSGLDDRNEYVNPPLIDAILFSNTWAFDELLKRKADVHQESRAGSAPLFLAASSGNTYMVRELLKHGADPLDYRKGTCLPLTLEFITSSALVEPQSRWRYDNESPDTDNAALKQQISDFFLQEGRYTPPKASAVIPFVAPEHVIHVHYGKGKLEILGLLLNRQVLPTIPVSDTTRSPLAIVQNPTKYSAHFRSDAKEKLEYIGTETENPNVLLFTMTLVNKRNTGTTSTIVVHYDLEPSRKLIEGALNPHTFAVTASLSREMQETGNKLNAQLAEVQRRLSGVRSKTEQVGEEVKSVKDVLRYDEQQEIAEFRLLIKGHPNATEAYNRFITGLEAIHTSAVAGAGGFLTVGEGPVSLVASALGITTELVDMIPVFGSATSKFFKLGAVVAKRTDVARQTNLCKNIAALGPTEYMQKTFEAVARKLTRAYLLQFARLATKQLAEQQMSRPQHSLQSAKEKVLKSKLKSPAQQVATFAIIWMMDEVFNNAHELDKEIADKGLETLLLNAVTQHSPPETLTTFWDTITKEGLGTNAIPTQSASGTILGETWHPADFWTAPGVLVQNASGSQYFTGNYTNVAKFGYRLGSLEDVAALGLTPTTETALLPQPSALSSTTTPSANSKPAVTPPSPTVTHAYPNTPQASPRSSSSTACSASTTCTPSSSTQALKPEAKPDPKRNKSPFGIGRFRTCLTAT